MKKALFVFLLALAVSPLSVLAESDAAQTVPTRVGDPAQTVPTKIPISIPNPVGSINSLSDLFYKIVNFVVSLSYVVIAFFLLLAGFKFVTAQGSEDKLTDAKNTFKYTVIGAILIIGAQVIVDVVKGIITQIAA